MKEKVSKRPSRSAPKSSQRAQRFEIKVPVRYREQNQEKWHEGRTENISQSGSSSVRPSLWAPTL